MRKVTRALYWDMDGTIADLYSVPDWLPKLRAGDESPYLEARPMCDMHRLRAVLDCLVEDGWHIGIITWLSMGGSDGYAARTRDAKRIWLRAHGLAPYMDEMHLVKYGRAKHRIAARRGGVLVDDNKDVRDAWERYGGIAIDPTAGDVVEMLRQLL